MINKKNLKPGDEVAAVYTHGYAAIGKIIPVIIKKITNDYIIAEPKGNNSGRTIEFINDDEMQYKGLSNSYYTTQSLKLFLGTVEEAQKADSERCEAEEFYSSNQDFIFRNITKANLEDLNKIVKILKKYEKH